MRKTKIICTIGPASVDFDMLRQLAVKGMNVARLNMSHGTHEWHYDVIRHIRTLNKQIDFTIAVLLDTKGPEVRTGDLRSDMVLNMGDTLTMTIRHVPVLEPGWVEIRHDGFINEVDIGDIVLVDGGMLSFLVKQKTATDVVCECIDGGTLSSRRHINIRGKSADLPSITKGDWRDIDFGIENQVDFIALSFVRGPESIVELKKYLRKKKAHIDIIAKIESADSIPLLDEIIEASDGIMIARGDLGSELPYEEVPLLQDTIIRKCRAVNKPVIVATHMLESMIVNPTPTRAEVTDISHAVFQGTDTVMLSGETAKGKHPVRSLEAMDTVIRRIEKQVDLDTIVRVKASLDSKEEIARSAAILNNNLRAVGTLVFTRRGLMAVLLSRCRPISPIFAFTNTTHVRRRLNMHWGIHALRINFSKDPEVSIQRAIGQLLRKSLVKEGDRVIVLSDILASGMFVETVQVRVISSEDE